MTPTSSLIPPTPTPKAPSSFDPALPLIKKVALESLTEFSFALITTGATIYFSASTFAMLPLIYLTVKVLTFNLATRATFVFMRVLNPKRFTFLQKALEIIPAITYQWVDAQRDELFHELGHSISASLLYKNADPKIYLLPIGRKTTRYQSHFLSTLGNRLGWKKADFFVTLAGPLVSVAIATTTLAIAKLLPDSYQSSKRYLYASSITSIFRSAIYAQQAVGASIRGSKGHDFVDLARHGIDPSKAVQAILLAPLVTWIAIHLLQHYKQSASPSTSSQ